MNVYARKLSCVDLRSLRWNVTSSDPSSEWTEPESITRRGVGFPTSWNFTIFWAHTCNQILEEKNWGQIWASQQISQPVWWWGGKSHQLKFFQSTPKIKKFKIVLRSDLGFPFLSREGGATWGWKFPTPNWCSRALKLCPFFLEIAMEICILNKETPWLCT